MNTLVFVLMMQVAAPHTSFLISTKAGLVNYVRGTATVKAAGVAKAGKPVETGPNSAVEILLNPGSYLRVGENSKVVLEKVELYDIAVRIIEGSAVIEANGFSKDLPLAVSTGDLKLEIIKDGVYLFADGKVVVVDGKIRDTNNGRIYGKSYEIASDDTAQKVKTFSTGLELWSQKRDAEIAAANGSVARSLSQTPGLPLGSFLDVWYWYAPLGSFIYLPGGRYRSPYGFVYQPVNYGGIYRGNNGGGGYNGGGGNSTTTNTGNAGNAGNSGNSGVSGGGGGVAAAPAPVGVNNPSSGIYRDPGEGGKAKISNH